MFFLRGSEHRAGGISAALRSVPWQRPHRGSWAPAFAGETRESAAGTEKAWRKSERRERGLVWRRSLSSFSRRTPGSRDHGALGGGQKDIEPPRSPRHGG